MPHGGIVRFRTSEIKPGAGSAQDQPSNTAVRLSVRPGMSGWAQVNGAKLVTKEEKEKLDEWYVRNASLWVDLRIIMLTLSVMLKMRVSAEEAAADTEQVQNRHLDLQQTIAIPRRLAAGERR